MAYSTRPLRQQLVSVYFLLLLAATMLFVIGMPGIVGAEWPGWTSTVFVGPALPVGLPELQVRPAGPSSVALETVADDIDLESEAASLRTGLTTVAQVVAGIPAHVLDRWGTRGGRPSEAGLRFAGRTWSRTVFGGMVLARGEEFVPPDYSVSTLVIVAAVLAVVAGCCGAIDRLLARPGTSRHRSRATGVAA